MRISPIILTLVLSFIILSNSYHISRETYEEIKKVATFEMIEYEEYLDTYKDGHYGYSHSFDDLIAEAKEAHEDYKNEHLQFLGEEQPKHEFESLLGDYVTLPSQFDWRNVYPQCFSTPIKDQVSCGSCYAFSSTFVLAKRICLYDTSFSNLDLSPQDMVSCDGTNKKCHGAALPNVWRYLENYGVTTESCKPYNSSIDIYGQEHYPKCYSECDYSSLSYNKYPALKGTMKTFHTNYQTQEEIYKYGPVSSYMNAYDDMYLYKGGIYRPTNKTGGGGHAISLVGWGYDSYQHTYYWIVANSWGKNWGENGYFKIPFGECDVNLFSVASSPLNSVKKTTTS